MIENKKEVEGAPAPIERPEEGIFILEDTREGNVRKVLITLERIHKDISVKEIVKKIEEILRQSADEGQSITFEVRFNKESSAENPDEQFVSE